MKVELVYPLQEKRTHRHEKIRRIISWLFIATAYACPIINLCVGGKAWSIVVIWCMWFVWSVVFAPDLVEYNRISQASKLLIHTCILLVLIELFLSPGWADFVIPILSVGTLIIIGVFFLSDISKQKQNLMPMFWIIVGSLTATASALVGFSEMNWPMVVLGSTALALLVVSIVVLKKDSFIELKKRFHTK